jgi:hypothetical protein
MPNGRSKNGKKTSFHFWHFMRRREMSVPYIAIISLVNLKNPRIFGQFLFGREVLIIFFLLIEPHSYSLFKVLCPPATMVVCRATRHLQTRLLQIIGSSLTQILEPMKTVNFFLIYCIVLIVSF